MKLSDFNYSLPQELIAQYPAPRRDGARVMLLKRESGEISHRDFTEFSHFLKAGDALVLNNTKVVPARIFGRRPTGGKVELFLLEKLDDKTYDVLVRPSRRIKNGEKVIIGNGRIKAKITKRARPSTTVEFEGAIEELFGQGSVPLPPYIKRPVEPQDKERYQTIYAHDEGATAAPTAGLHFTGPILEEVKKKKVEVCFVTLHTSYGTFAPVKVEDITRHRMHKEYFRLSEETAQLLNRTKKEGGRIIAVGTTTARVLESCVTDRYILKAREGYTDLFIYPPYKFKMVDGLLTNFHLPGSTLIMLVSAFCGRDFLLKAYQEAIEARYRFYSYGDCMFIT